MDTKKVHCVVGVGDTLLEAVTNVKITTVNMRLNKPRVEDVFVETFKETIFRKTFVVKAYIVED